MNRSLALSFVLASTILVVAAALGQTPGAAHAVPPSTRSTVPVKVQAVPSNGAQVQYYSLDRSSTLTAPQVNWSTLTAPSTNDVLNGDERYVLNWTQDNTRASTDGATKNDFKLQWVTPRVQIKPRVLTPASGIDSRNLLFTPADQAKTRVFHPLMTPDVKVQGQLLQKPVTPKH